MICCATQLHLLRLFMVVWHRIAQGTIMICCATQLHLLRLFMVVWHRNAQAPFFDSLRYPIASFAPLYGGMAQNCASTIMICCATQLHLLRLFMVVWRRIAQAPFFYSLRYPIIPSAPLYSNSLIQTDMMLLLNTQCKTL